MIVMCYLCVTITKHGQEIKSAALQIRLSNFAWIIKVLHILMSE